MNSHRRLLEAWRRLDVTVRDLPLALLLLGASFVPAFHTHGTQVGGVPDRPFDLLAVAVAALECLPLAVRRRRPAVCTALVVAGFAADQLLGYHMVAGTGFAVAILSAGAHLERYRRTAMLLLSAAYVPLAIALYLLGSGEPVSEFLLFYLAVAFVWGIGAWLRSSRAKEAERRRLVAEETRTAERTRIARELHDVVTHHVTAMVVQAEAARYLTAAPDRLDQTLTTVTDTGRRAITDLRHLLDLLDPDHGTGPRTPSAGRLLTLVEQARRSGQPVEFAEEGTPAESTGSADLVAYRIVQEALTNALKYAHGSRTSVRVRHGEKEITVEVGTDGSGSRAGFSEGSGRGLEGLRERVDLLGGEFSAGPRTGGGFAVQARIPAGSPA
ncbi:sensor histidine kinase [Nocardiopsis composta]|uniref:histidine kinase n=1 Tax=Nocardiopsis composta TaxID=157465 RepID=A0A7W8QNJ0_9ACTN|nr:histidine kinase [Nocardiopsis composta]MBB5433519.1 signal transduction histidine kinase [Nocardiopsis composta]